MHGGPAAQRGCGGRDRSAGGWRMHLAAPGSGAAGTGSIPGTGTGVGGCTGGAGGLRFAQPGAARGVAAV